jgi:FAD:protein FMN transferase
VIRVPSICLAGAALLAWTCGPASTPPAAVDAGRGTPPPIGPTPPVVDGGAGETAVLRRSRGLMGTVFEILVVETPGSRPDEALNAAFDEIARLEELMSEWRPGSEISRVNAGAGRTAVTVSPEIIEILGEARRVSEASHGAFDASWAALRGLWHFRLPQPVPNIPPTPAEARARARNIDYRLIRVDAAERTVKLDRPGMGIGLGGIAKGYALDRAAAILRSHGLHDFVVYAGGQVFVSGKRGDRPWRVGIQHPRRPDAYFAYFSPGDGAVSTSGDYERFFIHEGVRYHHVIDPATGYPANKTVAVTIIAPKAVSADAWATALFVLGPQEGLAVTMTPGFRRELSFTMPLEEAAAAPTGPPPVPSPAAQR